MRNPGHGDRSSARSCVPARYVLVLCYVMRGTDMAVRASTVLHRTHGLAGARTVLHRTQYCLCWYCAAYHSTCSTLYGTDAADAVLCMVLTQRMAVPADAPTVPAHA
eukprot:1450175-Rhodomonas_salina.1